MKKRLIFFISKHWGAIALLTLVSLGFFLRLYGLDTYSQFGWDQVDNAWAAKNILVDHKILLSGMVAKGNSGIYIGPLYYYAIAVFYFFTHLDPVASILFAAATSVFSMVVIFYVTKKIFSTQVAFISLFIQIVSFAAITFDRVQWPVDFIPAISLLVLYFVYKVITGNENFLLWLGLVTGLAFHIHFTAIYFPILIFLSFPFFPRTKKTLFFGSLGIAIFLTLLIPSIITFFQNKSYGNAVLHYGSSSYHGIHLRRIIQLTNDAFIQFIPYLYLKPLYGLRLIFFPLFVILYWASNKTKKSFKILYLFGLWFLVPWVVLSAYSGEISDYYFASTRFIAVIILAYLFNFIFFAKKNLFVNITGVVIILLYSYVNLFYYFTHPTDRPLSYFRVKVHRTIKKGKVIRFIVGNPKSYLFYIYTKH